MTSGLRVAALLVGLWCGSALGQSAAPQPAPAKPHHAKPAAAGAETDAGYAIGPAPAWVVLAKERDTAPAMVPAPMHYRVIDEQTRLGNKSESNYIHVVRVVNDSSGLTAAARIEIEFDPSYQKLTLHHLDVVRAGRHLTRLNKRYPLLRRETQLERQMYDGRQTLSIVVDDVRAGDQIDYAFTITGSNPVFDGKFVRQVWLQNVRGPEALHVVRVLAPLAREVHYKVPASDVQVTTRTLGEMRETVFRREAVPQFSMEPGVPYSGALAEQLQLSEFTDWSEVVRWGMKLFAPGAGGELLDRQAAEIRQHADTPAARLLAALDFVQKEVRYFGTEIGANTHLPAPPDQVLKQRFGDCKDKVALLVALLARLDIAATPVLVSATLHGEAVKELPGPLAFDHVIARVALDGSTYYLDATRAHQSGTLARRQAIGFDQGLPLSADTTGPVALPSAYDAERLLAHDVIRFEHFQQDPTLESRITYRGDLAEAVREALARGSLADLTTQLNASYLKIYPRARAVGTMQVESSTEDDAVTLVQHFVVPDFWRFPEHRALVSQLVPFLVSDALLFPKSESRHHAMGFAFPGIIRHTVAVEFPEDVYRTPTSSRYEDGEQHLYLKEGVEGTRRRVEFSSQLQISRETVQPEEWTAFSSKVEELRHKLAYQITLPLVPLERIDKVNQQLKEALARRNQAGGDASEGMAQVNMLMLTAAIEGGRLPPPLEAQARAARGALYANEGQPEAAASDFGRALALAPDSVEVLSGAAVSALQTQQLDRAIELAGKALQQTSHYSEALETRARARYLKHDLAGARADLEELLKDPTAVHRGYPLVWLEFALRQASQDVGTATAAYSNMPTEWPRPLIDLAASHAAPEAVLSAAHARKKPAEALCEAYFYIGEDFYTRGNLPEARKSWQKATEQGLPGFVEDGAARLRLKSVPGQ